MCRRHQGRTICKFQNVSKYLSEEKAETSTLLSQECALEANGSLASSVIETYTRRIVWQSLSKKPNTCLVVARVNGIINNGRLFGPLCLRPDANQHNSRSPHGSCLVPKHMIPPLNRIQRIDCNTHLETEAPTGSPTGHCRLNGIRLLHLAEFGRYGRKQPAALLFYPQ
jgi:hypothetical protein